MKTKIEWVDDGGRFTDQDKERMIRNVRDGIFLRPRASRAVGITLTPARYWTERSKALKASKASRAVSAVGMPKS